MIYRLFWLFLAYAFLGWVGETAVVAARRKQFVNRGLLNGPLCVVYGITAVVLTVSLDDQRNNLWWLFFFCMLDASVIEWFTGYLLERTGRGRWWDYSHIPLNLSGYICLPYSLLWGALGMAALLWVNPLLLKLYDSTPVPVRLAVLWVCFGLLVLDTYSTLMVIYHWKEPPRRLRSAQTQMGRWTRRLGRWIAARVTRRLDRAHTLREEEETAPQEKGFAAGCGFYKLAYLFVIGSALGAVAEIFFCRYSMGRWMSRSSLVWGQFSVVWGLALCAGTLLLYPQRWRSDAFLFLVGTVAGGAYEYACSVFTERMYGMVFWSYSHLPFNLGGRINLLYCFFWGIAAVIWLRLCYPVFSKWIEKIPARAGKIIAWCLTVFMAVNMVVSTAALRRYQERTAGVPAQNPVAEFIDEHFDDERMQTTYSNIIWK